MVTTTRGELPREDVYYEDAITEQNNVVITAREWFHRIDGAMVRRDVWADIKSGVEAAAQKGN